MRNRYPFYLWLVPLIWALGTMAQHRFPGDENAFYILSALPAVWITPFIMLARISTEASTFCIALAGAPVMALIGWGMDRLRVSKILWLSLYAALAGGVYYAIVASYPSVERAIGANGSLWAYRLLGMNLGLYLSTVFSVIATATVRAARRPKIVVEPHSGTPSNDVSD